MYSPVNTANNAPKEFVVRRGERREPHQLCKTQQMYGAISAALLLFFFWHAILLLKRAGKQLGLQASSFWTQVTQKRKKFPPRRGLCKDVDTSKSILWTFVAFDIYVAIQLCASDVRRDFVATSTKVTHRCKKKKKND